MPVRRASPSPAAADAGLRLDDFLPYRLSLASNAVSNLIHETYVGLFALKIPEWRIMALLGETDGLTQQEIGLRTRMDKVTVSRTARALQDRQLVERSVNPQDGRSSRLALSPQGRTLYDSIAPAALGMESEILAEFSADDVKQLKATLRRLEEAALRISRGA